MRKRLASGWLALVLFGLGGAVGASPAERSAPSAGPAADRETAGQVAARRRSELDELQRQDVAAALVQLGVGVDWRALSLEQLLDIRLRIAKVAELRTRFGIAVDWRRYNWDQLEGVRRALAGLEAPRAAPRSAANDPDAVLAPTFAGRRTPATVAGDPDAVLAPTFTARRAPPAVAGDPDAVLAPTFAARLRPPRGSQDPDGLMAPTFSPVRRALATSRGDDPDALLAPMF